MPIQRTIVVGGVTWIVEEDDDIILSKDEPMPTITFQIDSHIKPPRTKKARKCPANVHTAYAAYSDAYKKVFGVSPSGFTYDKATKFIHVDNGQGVTLLRLKELTRQYKLRAGE